MLKRWIEEGLSAAGLRMKWLAGEDVATFRGKVADKFCVDGSERYPMWERLDHGGAYHLKDMAGAVANLAQLPLHGGIMFFDDPESNLGLQFRRADELAAFLLASYGFPFYLADAELQYLIAFNDHDVVICCGESVKWIDIIAQDRSKT